MHVQHRAALRIHPRESVVNIRRMIPMGTRLRKCAVCGAQITARRDDDYPTAHEWECLSKLLTEKAEQDK
jgi:hypothetical protein